jgi:hypothetical protein
MAKSNHAPDFWFFGRNTQLNTLPLKLSLLFAIVSREFAFQGSGFAVGRSQQDEQAVLICLQTGNGNLQTDIKNIPVTLEF